ncbi:MAG: hypothetical protein HKN30_14780 [Sulfitobacter sp.]|nr:hypothetical protein [Sulfitobacter sp.]
MGIPDTPLGQHRSYFILAAAACVCATLFALTVADAPLPGIGAWPLLPIVFFSALFGLPLLVVIKGRLLSQAQTLEGRHLLILLGLAALLTLPPVAIDLTIAFPKHMNVPLPGALLFYFAIALVAEVVFHLIPLAALAITRLARVASPWAYLPAVLAEPAFQAALGAGTTLQGWLVFGNVALISGVQVWLFVRYGFAAMMGLRLAYYLFWHVLWGTLRLPILF